MLIFLSWSGKRSKSVAEALSSWLSEVIQAVEPWISSDVEKGVRWGPEITTRLQASPIGIICLTQDNLSAPWLLFEAGAISNTRDAHVCTFLLGVPPTDVQQPLAQFQHTSFDKADVKRLLATINQRLDSSGGRGLSERTLDNVFELNWPRLESILAPLCVPSQSKAQSKRSEREMLQEALELLRAQDRRESEAQLRRHAARIRDMARPLAVAPVTAAQLARLGLTEGQTPLGDGLLTKKVE